MRLDRSEAASRGTLLARLAAAAALFSSCAALGPPRVPSAADPPGIDDLAFLEGTFAGPANDEGHVFETTYGGTYGGVLLGMSKEYDARHRAVWYEFEVFTRSGDDLVLLPHPGGKRSVEFRLTALERDAPRARFENPAHDFPRAITYERAGSGNLCITLTGEEDGRPRTWVLELERTD